MKELTEKERLSVANMVDVLILVSMVDRYYIGLMDEVICSGRFKHGIKRDMNRCEKLICSEHSRAWRLFSEHNKDVGVQYTSVCDKIDSEIDAHIALQGEDRYLVIIGSILEYIEDLVKDVPRKMISGFDSVCSIRKILNPHLTFDSNKAIKFIIRQALQYRHKK